MSVDTQQLTSVIIAVKDGERFLANAITSILRSTYAPIEIIVVDGHSQDRSARIAQSFKEVRYIAQTDNGIADAYNIGISAAKGDFIGFLSSDDEWLPEKLAIQVTYLIDNPQTQGVVSKVKFFLEEGCSMPRSFRKELLQENPVAFIMETLLVRKNVFDIVGKFNTEYSVAEDVDWFMRARKMQVPIEVIPEVLLRKRVHDKNASLTSSWNSQYLLKILRESIQRSRHE